MRIFFSLLLAGAVSAQGVSGSESFVALAPVTPNASGNLASAAYRAHAVVGLAPSAAFASSGSFALQAGVVLTPPALAPGAPLVFGAAPGSGDKTGGEPVTVRGFAFDDGSGAATVHLGGGPVPGAVASNTTIHVTTPPGAGALGNPLGPVAVTVSTALGTATRDDAFVYTPATVQVGEARVGQTLTLALDLPPASLRQLLFGGAIPGFGVPVPPLEGALEIVAPLIQLTPFALSPTGMETLSFPVPGDPALAGAVVPFQAVALTGLTPVAGSFTNRVDVAIQP
jgi:hypothetical protein